MDTSDLSAGRQCRCLRQWPTWGRCSIQDACLSTFANDERLQQVPERLQRSRVQPSRLVGWETKQPRSQSRVHDVEFGTRRDRRAQGLAPSRQQAYQEAGLEELQVIGCGASGQPFCPARVRDVEDLSRLGCETLEQRGERCGLPNTADLQQITLQAQSRIVVEPAGPGHLGVPA